ncbi:hypothetical protein CAPSP0001_1220 [Capnocytophaga sputigena ATCC 33612]|uniref:Uncharacterized protein n=2 Tax=Capnocytophaga sputigena TaxID=1019 RepID=A0AAX2IBP3_CAPSP|nr:hypothetical protein CAPSP0001_1220 [Capnocytophaga sputigena ATCC 33612]SQA75549.1 Uncharacterised protein [Capnocytophaga sputigena]
MTINKLAIWKIIFIFAIVKEYSFMKKSSMSPTGRIVMIIISSIAFFVCLSQLKRVYGVIYWLVLFNVVMWLANAVASTIILIRDYKRKKNSREEAK